MIYDLDELERLRSRAGEPEDDSGWLYITPLLYAAPDMIEDLRLMKRNLETIAKFTSTLEEAQDVAKRTLEYLERE